MNFERQLVKGGTAAYYFSSLFLPRQQRDDILKLYSFVSVVDDYVDAPEPDKQHFKETRRLWVQGNRNNRAARTNSDLSALIVSNILYLSEVYKFRAVWIRAFFSSMQMDLKQKRFKTIDDTLEYMYGSAEVVGMMLAKILGLDRQAQQAARLQGRALQYIHFIRDIPAANARGRCYFPQKELKKFGLKDLSEKTARAHPDRFTAFVVHQIGRYRVWQEQADAGMQHIPRRWRLLLKAAIQRYEWKAAQISLDPMSIFDGKLKPIRVRHFQATLARFKLD